MRYRSTIAVLVTGLLTVGAGSPIPHAGVNRSRFGGWRSTLRLIRSSRSALRPTGHHLAVVVEVLGAVRCIAPRGHGRRYDIGPSG